MSFDTEENIQHLRRRLEYGAEELIRSVLIKQFLHEEKMLGLTQEQLRRIDRHTTKLRQLISEQTKRVERLASLGIDTEARRLVLATLNDLLAAYHVHRQRITAALVGDSAVIENLADVRWHPFHRSMSAVRASDDGH